MAKLRDDIATTDGPPLKDKRTRKRIIVYQNDDGSPILSDLTDEQRATLGIGGGGSVEPAAAEPPAEIPPHIAGMMLNLMVSIESAIVAPRIGIPQADAARALEPPQPIAAGIVDAGTKVLNKYAGGLGLWADELALFSLIVVWQSAAFAEMRRLVELKKTDPRPAPPDEHFTKEPARDSPRPVPGQPAPNPAKPGKVMNWPSADTPKVTTVRPDPLENVFTPPTEPGAEGIG